MAGCGVDLTGSTRLDDLALVHDGDAVADVLDDRQIVGHEDQRQVQLVDQVGDEVEDLGADRDVEGADRFVGDQDARAGCEGSGDGDALALTAGELVRVPVPRVSRQADCLSSSRTRSPEAG